MDYPLEAQKARRKVLDLIYKAGTSHIGSNFSCIDILTVLFDKIDLEKDVFVMSAGWKAASLYYFLHQKGKITDEELDSYCQEGSKFIGLSEPIIPEIKVAGGSMGLGLPGAVGIAMAKKLKKENGKVYVLMSDGELQCGTTWESFAIANKHKLDNLVVIVDYNGLQAMGKVEDILPVDNMSLGCNIVRVDGHDFPVLQLLFEGRVSKQSPDTPLLVIAKTVKGKGVPKWEGDNLWHYAKIQDDDYKYAKSCLK